MALLQILHYPDPRLHKVAAPVTRVDDKIRKLIKDMAETMYAAPGIGLAATQVDVHLRVIVIDVSEARDQLRVFVNPELLAASGDPLAWGVYRRTRARAQPGAGGPGAASSRCSLRR